MISGDIHDETLLVTSSIHEIAVNIRSHRKDKRRTISEAPGRDIQGHEAVHCESARQRGGIPIDGRIAYNPGGSYGLVCKAKESR